MVTAENVYTLEYLSSLCDESPFVPAGHVALWAKGLWHGLNGDYPSAASVLVPQLENLVRHLLKKAGAHTLIVDESGVESEKGLGTLLDLPEASDLLGSGLTLELRALLTEQEGANLRNHVAHGLLTDAEAWSYNAVYAWWLCLRLVMVPLATMRAEGTSIDETATHR